MGLSSQVQSTKYCPVKEIMNAEPWSRNTKLHLRVKVKSTCNKLCKTYTWRTGGRGKKHKPTWLKGDDEQNAILSTYWYLRCYNGFGINLREKRSMIYIVQVLTKQC